MRPMLGDLELETVQRIETEEGQVLTRHQVPALEGDFLQRLGRRGSRVTLAGVVAGPGSRERLQGLRSKLRAAEPVSFVSDVATATRLAEVMLEELEFRELAGKPERYEVALALRELTEPPAVEEEEPPDIPDEPPPDDEIDDEVGTLVVEVLVEGEEDFDFEQVTVTARGTGEDGEPFARTLAAREANVWTEAGFPAAEVTVEATAPSPAPAVASAPATVAPGETATLTLTLRPGTPVATAFRVHFHFDNSFVEPCMRPVLRQVAERAGQAGSTERILIVGHTDKTGPDRYNQSLSERRARAVFAFLIFGRDRERAVAEWTALRQRRPAGELPSEKDSWGVREYQYMLQDLGFYPGKIDEDHGPLTDDAVRAFRCRKGLPPGTRVDNDPAVWAALIEDYLAQDSLAVAEDSFLPNARDGCDGGVVEWLGCGEEQPLPEPQPTRRTAHRPYRRTEILFVPVSELSCEVRRPDTFLLPPPAEDGAVPRWCLGPEDSGERCCFATRECDDATEGQLCIQDADPRTITVEGRIENEDGTPFARKRFVLIAPDGTIKPRESSSGEPQPGRTGADGSFRFEDLPVGVYTLQVCEKVLVRLDGEPESSIKGNSVCKELREAGDRLDVVVSSAPVLREIELPVVAHLMTALHPVTREVRTCPDPLDPARRRLQATRHDAAAVRRFFDGANDVWRQARVRFDPVRVVEEVYSFRTECEVDTSEFAIVLERCGYPNVVNVFFFGDIEGQVEAGVYILAPVADARGMIDGCAVTDRFNFVIFQPPILVELNDDQTVQVVAHELGHFLGLDHVSGAGNLMREASPSGADRTISEPEVRRARMSCNAALECVTLRLDVRDATRVGVEGSPEHLVIQVAGGVVTVEAVLPAPLLEVGALEVTGGEPGATPTQRRVPTDATGTTEIFAVYTPAAGSGAATCTPNAAAGATPAPLVPRMVTRAVVRVVTFELRVEGAARRTGGTDFVSLSDAVTVIAQIDPSPFCVSRDLVTWSGGDEAPDRLRRRVLRGASADPVVLRATVAGVTRQVTITFVTVELRTISFNHDSASAASDGLNLRENATEFLSVPEWRAGSSVSPEDSMAAYAIAEVSGNTLTIQAQLRLPVAAALTAEVRSVAPTGAVLGEVRPRTVTFQANGQSGPVLFELQNTGVAMAGVGIHDIEWQWQFRRDASAPWRTFQTTRHRIFTILALPTAPWQQVPFGSGNTQLPWTEVLEQACRWASGATTLDEAARLVTVGIDGLAPSRLEYDCPGGGATHYAFPDFDCTAFLERIRGRAGRGRYINCTDCATALSTFANALGCDLWQSRMGGTGFALNPILAIGSSVWQTACGWGGFLYHEVAWKGGATSDDEVFDACLKVDGDPDPTGPPHTPLQPANLRFGDPGDGEYRDRLASPAGRPTCEPRPSTRRRRRVR